jgi:hypothetical protein
MSQNSAFGRDDGAQAGADHVCIQALPEAGFGTFYNNTLERLSPCEWDSGQET